MNIICRSVLYYGDTYVSWSISGIGTPCQARSSNPKELADRIRESISEWFRKQLMAGGESLKVEYLAEFLGQLREKLNVKGTVYLKVENK